MFKFPYHVTDTAGFNMDMESAPRDGTDIDVVCVSEAGNKIVVPKLHYAHAPMDKAVMILWGNNNFLSPYLTPIGWKPSEEIKEDTT